MDKIIKEFKDNFIEDLADAQHKIWSDWMKYLFSKSETTTSGRLIIPNWAVKRWKRQMETKYENLSEEEKENDRNVVRKYLHFIFED